MIRIRCSNLARVMACSGSIAFDLPKEESGEPAREGTAAGEWMQFTIEGKTPGTHASNGYAFDADMDFYTRPLALEILAVSRGTVKCEQPIDWQTRSGVIIQGKPDADYILTTGAEEILCIDDLKYGWSLVEVKPNWQLLGYAIGSMIKHNRGFHKIRLRIFQPRPHHEDGPLREWILTYDELLHYKEMIEAKATAIANGDKTLTTSEKCRYCPAAAEACPALNKAAHRGLEVTHSFVQDNITDAELAFQLGVFNRAAELIKIKKDSIEQLAISRLASGHLINGWTTTKSYGDRTWKKGVSPDVIQMMSGCEITKREMLSPAQAEIAGVPKELVNSLVDRFYKGEKLKQKDSGAIAEKVFGKMGAN